MKSRGEGARTRRLTRDLSAVGLAWALTLNPIARASAQPVAHAPAGELAGVEQSRAVAFLGIPYAAAPTGDRRWRPPAPPPRWEGVRQAAAFGAICPQPKAATSAAGPQSEDCLFLNVWAPRDALAGKLPVMVSIHGGAYILGSGNLADTSAYTRDGVILVSINYRLGRLGQFAHPALTAENPAGPLASYSLMDQVAALRWVRDNIASFGGDPGNVTIFGCSAGGTYVNLLMASPEARGLFHRAIAESDPFNTPWPRVQRVGPDRSGSAEDAGARFAASLGLDHATAAQLRELPVEKLLNNAASNPTDRIQPIVDGQYVAAQGLVSFQKGAIAHVPYITSINSWEGVLSRSFKGTEEILLRNLGPWRDKVLALHPDSLRQDRTALAAPLMDDVSFRAAQRTIAGAATKAGLPTWALYFDYVAEPLRATGAPGAAHCDDSSYAFERPDLRAKFTPTAGDMKVAQTWHKYQVNFAKTGDPNGPSLPAWPRYGGAARILTIRNEGVAVARNPDAKRMKVLIPASEAMARGVGLSPPAKPVAANAP